MKLKNVLIVVKDIERSRRFYQCVGHYDNAEDVYSEFFFLKRINCRI